MIETGLRLAKRHPGHQFIFVTEDPELFTKSPAGNTEVIAVDKIPSGATGRSIWNYKLSRKIRKKYTPSLVIGSPFASYLPGALQIIIVQPALLNAAHTKSFIRHSEKITCLLVFSAFEKELLMQKARIPSEKIQVIYPGYPLPEVQTSFEEKEALQERYADKNEYFVYSGPLGNTPFLTTLLKAFSGFKKWSRSHTQLLLTGSPGDGFAVFQKSLESYRFRSSVSLLGDLPKAAHSHLIAAANAAIFPEPQAVDPAEFLHAMSCGTAILAARDGIYPEIGADSALYFEPGNKKEITECMLRLFREEKLRSILSGKSPLIPKRYTWENSASELWKLISLKTSA